MSRFRLEADGQVATAVVALARWGLACSYVGKVGEDELGTFTVGELQRAGVDTSAVTVASGAASRCAAIFIDEVSGERTIVWHRLEEALLKKERGSTGSAALARDSPPIQGHLTFTR